jgi:hypothetical protein
MISLSTNRYYYIKRPSIVKKISFDNRTFYSKFERIDEPLSDLVISQHLAGDYTVAIPLIEDNKIDKLVIEYKGSNSMRFYHLSNHILKTLNITKYSHYRGAKDDKITLIISVDRLPIDEAYSIVNRVSDALSSKMTKEWKSLPDISLPNEYNILVLPYEQNFDTLLTKIEN